MKMHEPDRSAPSGPSPTTLTPSIQRRVSPNAVHEGAGPDQDSSSTHSFLIQLSASCTKTRADEAPGSMSGEVRRRLRR